MFNSYGNSEGYLLLLKADEFLRDRAVVAALKCFDGMVFGMHSCPALFPGRNYDHILKVDPHNEQEALQAVKNFHDETGLRPTVVIEVAARPGGDGIMDLVERVYGINMYEAHIRSYIGDSSLNRMNLDHPAQGIAAIAFIPPNLAGSIGSIRLNNDFPPEVLKIYLNKKVGDKVEESLHYDDRLGTVEFYWPDSTLLLGSNKHLEIASNLGSEIYDIEST